MTRDEYETERHLERLFKRYDRSDKDKCLLDRIFINGRIVGYNTKTRGDNVRQKYSQKQFLIH